MQAKEISPDQYVNSLPEERKEAIEYLDKLISKHAVVEIKQKHHSRSLNQNSYLHLLLGYTRLYD